jgi:hypothetical protein
MQAEPSRPPPVPPEPPEVAPQREHGIVGGGKLAPAEHAALIARLDSGHATKADWADYDRLLDAMLGQSVRGENQRQKRDLSGDTPCEQSLTKPEA